MWEQNRPAKWVKSDVFNAIFANFVLAKNDIDRKVQDFERESLLSPNCTKFAVEIAWKTEISQNLQNCKIRGFLKNRWNFPEKNLERLQSFLKRVSNGIIC